MSASAKKKLRKEQEAAKIQEKLLKEKKELYERKYGAHVEIIPGDVLEISSTEIRERIQNHGDLTELLPAGVIDIIRREHLYGG